MTAIEESAPARNLLSVEHLVQEFIIRDHGGVKGGVLQAVSDVSFTLHHGETLGIVGETGSGKSTLARSILHIPPPRGGKVVFDGEDLTALSRKNLALVRQNMQIVFQEPFGSLDPRWAVQDIVEEPLRAQASLDRAARRRKVEELLDFVGLDPLQYGLRHPRELSGGQCQRVAIARAIATSPKLVICDEAVSSLDVLVQAQILNLFERLRTEFNLSYLFIAHDLGVVRQVSDRVLVMYLGRVCEIGASLDLYGAPAHPYTAALLASVPNPEPTKTRRDQGAAELIQGEVPSPLDPPSGCRFRTRCPFAQARCASEVPELREIAPDHLVACHFPYVAASTVTR